MRWNQSASPATLQAMSPTRALFHVSLVTITLAAPACTTTTPQQEQEARGQPGATRREGGQVVNYSSKGLWVLETDSGTPVAHRLAAHSRSPNTIDADAVRTIDGRPISGHASWWKIVDVARGDILDSTEGPIIRCWPRLKVEDDYFGPYQFNPAEGWGDPL